MISKKLFVETMRFMLKKRKQEDDLDKALAKMQGEFYSQVFIYNEHHEQIIKLLNEAFNLKVNENFGTDLEYYIYELEWGKRVKELDKNCALYGVNSLEKLYDYLVKVSEKNENRCN